MQSSADAGVVVVSFGSMVTNLTAERADVIATAFGQIPQKVRSSAHSDLCVLGQRQVKHSPPS